MTATLTGTVEDQSDGVIPGAQVTLTNEATKFSTAVQTNGTGLYAFPSLVPGTYDIKAAAKGFKNKVVSGIGSATYFGTDEALPIMPKLTSNPTSNLGHYQLLNGTAFTAPAAPPPTAVGRTPAANGGQAYPYMHAMAYFDNDLAISRTFHIYEKQQVQFRMSAFDWLNHALPQYSSLTPLTLAYKVDYATQAITPNYPTSGTGAFGVMDTKSQAPYARVIELDVKYSF